MSPDFLIISIRNQAVYIPANQMSEVSRTINETTAQLLLNFNKMGFGISEQLLRALNATRPGYKSLVLDTMAGIMGMDKNWTPLVKGWNIPTGETFVDHIYTFIANIFGTRKGTSLSCGHIIPDNTFPLERYNGCPFCGTPFMTGEIEITGQCSKLKVLELWTENELSEYFNSLLGSKTALDATQVENLKLLLRHFAIPNDVEIGIKETLMLVIDTLVVENMIEQASGLFTTPADILRYLWYKHTGFLQIVQPKTIIRRKSKNHGHMHAFLDQRGKAFHLAKTGLKMKFSRETCRMYALWLNNLEMDAAKACEIMHPKRGIWVRVIRSLRLAEYSKRKGFERLAVLLDMFHTEKYTVFQGKIDHFRLKQDADSTFGLLKKRPGLFARSLFANMLWFGPQTTLGHFSVILDEIPARLLFTLNMYARYYFDRQGTRSVKPLGGMNKKIPANKLLKLYNDEQTEAMKASVENLCLLAIKSRFARAKTDTRTIYLEETLNYMPLPVGDRSETIQDLPSALMGTRFQIQGDTIRLFMQWGQGLPAQHMDMDLSCWIAYDHKSDYCSYSKLVTTGCKHSGDIRQIPDKVGTAEYIDLNIPELEENKARYISFTCNAYSVGEITPGLVVGWMDSKNPMHISESTGVAYDPSCVQHQVRISQNLSKGLVFGIIVVETREIIWLELAFGGQVVQNIDMKGVKAILNKLNSKLNIGKLIKLKAEAQGLVFVDNKEEADEVYDYQWAINAAAVTKLFFD